MADVPGYTYVDIVRPDTQATEHVPEHWTYYAGAVTGRTIKPGVPWPSANAPKKCWNPAGIAPSTWVNGYGDLLAGKTLPLHMPDGPMDPEPEPEPEDPEFSRRAVAIARFLGRSGEARIKALAEEHAHAVAEFVFAYVQGNAGTREVDGSLTFPRDVEAVVVSATARLVTNPSQVDREAADGYSFAGSFKGFTLPELAILHRYRRRSA